MDNAPPTNQYSRSAAQNEDEIDLLALFGALLDQMLMFGDHPFVASTTESDTNHECKLGSLRS